jgi:diguanylate cyclase (GGDEF)-like protein
MTKRILNAAGVFVLVFFPVLALSFLAYTVFHQIILFIGLLIAGWAAWQIGTLIRERDRLGREVFLQAYEIKKAKETLESCLAVDTQTQVYNARLLEARLSEECERARRYRRPLSCLLVAIDSLSDLVQQHGSVISEVIVHEVGHFLKENTRSVDIIIRHQDNRFIAILPETLLNQARIAAERIRYAIEKNTFQIQGKSIKVTVSVGIVTFDPAIHRGKEDVLSALDRALTEAKKVGANRIAAISADQD